MSNQHTLAAAYQTCGNSEPHCSHIHRVNPVFGWYYYALCFGVAERREWSAVLPPEVPSGE